MENRENGLEDGKEELERGLVRERREVLAILRDGFGDGMGKLTPKVGGFRGIEHPL